MRFGQGGSGRYDSITAEQSEGIYYSIEWLLQQKASDLYSMCGADGAMYVFRRTLFQPCPPDTLIEDFVLPMQIVRQGYLALFEPRATAWEHGPSSLAEEYKRKVRIAAGSTQALLRANGVPRNAPLKFWFIWISHKLMRWLSPLVGLVMIALALAALPAMAAMAVLAFWGAVALLALVRWLTGFSSPVLNVPFYFLFSQIAMDHRALARPCRSPVRLVGKGEPRGVGGNQSESNRPTTVRPFNGFEDRACHRAKLAPTRDGINLGKWRLLLLRAYRASGLQVRLKRLQVVV